MAGVAEAGTDVLQLFREAMARLAAGVAVVTTSDDDGSPRGLTATSVTAYSADPPSLLLSVARECRSYGALVRRPRFAVHLLAEGQAPLAVDFARSDDRKFTLHPWRPGRDGVPILDDVMAVLVCRNERVWEHGDHAVVIGRLEDGELRDAEALVYFGRGFHRLPTEVPEARDPGREDL